MSMGKSLTNAKKGKGQSDFSDWPLLMPATTGFILSEVDQLPHTFACSIIGPAGFT